MSKTRGSAWKPILIGCGVVVFLGLVTFAVLGFFGYRAYKSRVATNPLDAELKAREIMYYAIPGGSKGIFSLDLSKDMGMKMAVVQSVTTSPAVILVVAKVPESMGKDASKTIEEQFQNSTKDDKHMVVQKSYIQKGTLCGEQTNLLFKEGTMESHGTTVPATSIEAVVRHRGAVYLGLIYAGGEKRQEAANAVLQSLSCKD